MILSHNGKTPTIDPSAYVAPTATICGDVNIGENSRIMPGACIIAEGEKIKIGSNCIVLENAVLRSDSKHSLSIGNYCLVGPNAHVVGCIIEDEVFVATGASIFHGAIIGARSEVRINGIVHLKTILPEDSTVPINWIAVGNPASILPPNEHDKIWEIQKPLNFPFEVYGYDRSEATMKKITERMSELLGNHLKDEEIR
jgi:carbonic anhydrase/acetyltransferase-like protein (isoleucine patch superfamily)